MNKINPILNHSAAHVLAQAILILYPEAKLTIGPAIEEGFYYDIDFGNVIVSSKDFAKIKKVMQKIISQNLAFTNKMVSKETLLEIYQNNPFKQELINNLEENNLQIVYTGNDFFDLCKGGHVHSTNQIKAFDLIKISSVYWRADASLASLTRIYGVAFDNVKDLEEHLEVLENRKKYDHRKLGEEQNLFCFSPIIGVGLPIWNEKGTITRDLIRQYINQLQIDYGIKMVSTPILGTKKLYETSGHWQHYQENMFPVINMENESYVLRPMTCPHHITLFQQNQYSYRDLPLIFGENSLLHRYESSGGLTGLERVRCMELIDTHAFVTSDQIKEIVYKFYQIILTAAKAFNLHFCRIDLSLANLEEKNKFFDNPAIWNKAENSLRNLLKELNVSFVEMKGEAAFYGPKIDFQVETIMKKIITIGTIQLDFLLPEKFDLTFKNSNNEFERLVMIHLGIIGTLERFFATLLEQTKGILPFWLAPVQVLILPIHYEKHFAYAEQILKILKSYNIRVEIDARDERLAKKIRDAQTSKVPYQIIIGDNEVGSENKISYRKYGEIQTTTIAIQEWVKQLVLDNQMPKTKLE